MYDFNEFKRHMETGMGRKYTDEEILSRPIANQFDPATLPKRSTQPETPTQSRQQYILEDIIKNAPRSNPVVLQEGLNQYNENLKAGMRPAENVTPEDFERLGNERISKQSPLWRRAIADPAIALAGKGVVGAGETLVGLADLVSGGQAGKMLDKTGYDPKATKAFMEEYQSPEQRAANAEVRGAKGPWNILKAAVSNPSTISDTVLESIPSMVGGFGIRGAIMKAAPKVSGVLAAALGEGAITAGSSAEGIRQETDTRDLNLKQTGLAVGSGAATALLGYMGGKLANRLGIADIDQAFIGQNIDDAAKKNIVRRMVEGGISEGLFEELPQSVQEQMAQNLATNKPISEGVDNAAVMGALSGAVMGGGMNIMQPQQATPMADPQAETTDKDPVQNFNDPNRAPFVQTPVPITPEAKADDLINKVIANPDDINPDDLEKAAHEVLNSGQQSAMPPARDIVNGVLNGPQSVVPPVDDIPPIGDADIPPIADMEAEPEMPAKQPALKPEEAAHQKLIDRHAKLVKDLRDYEADLSNTLFTSESKKLSQKKIDAIKTELTSINTELNKKLGGTKAIEQDKAIIPEEAQSVIDAGHSKYETEIEIAKKEKTGKDRGTTLRDLREIKKVLKAAQKNDPDAIEELRQWVGQKPPEAAPVVPASAEALPEPVTPETPAQPVEREEIFTHALPGANGPTQVKYYAVNHPELPEGHTLDKSEVVKNDKTGDKGNVKSYRMSVVKGPYGKPFVHVEKGKNENSTLESTDVRFSPMDDDAIKKDSFVSKAVKDFTRKNIPEEGGLFGAKPEAKPGKTLEQKMSEISQRNGGTADQFTYGDSDLDEFTDAELTTLESEGAIGEDDLNAAMVKRGAKVAAVPEVQPEPGKAKEAVPAHLMTRKEFDESPAYSEEKVGRFTENQAVVLNEDLSNPWTYTNAGGKGPRRFKSHQKIVKAALASGELSQEDFNRLHAKDYPDLQAKPAEAKPAQPEPPLTDDEIMEADASVEDLENLAKESKRKELRARIKAVQDQKDTAMKLALLEKAPSLLNDKGDQGAIIHPSTKQPGKWQVSRWDSRGFSGDTTVDSREKGIKLAIDDGYRNLDKAGAFKRTSKTKEFIDGVIATQQAQKAWAEEDKVRAEEREKEAEHAKAVAKLGKWTDFGGGVQRFRIGTATYGEVTDTGKAFGNTKAFKRFESSDGERFETMKEAKAYEIANRAAKEYGPDDVDDTPAPTRSEKVAVIREKQAAAKGAALPEKETGIYKRKVQLKDGTIKEMYAVPLPKRLNPKQDGFGDTLWDSEAEAIDKYKEQQQEEIEIEIRNKKIDEEEKQKAEAKQKEDADDLNGFLRDADPRQKALHKKTLSKEYRFSDGSIMSVRKRVEKLHADGVLKISTIEEPKIKPMSRRAYNQASQREQDDHDAKMKAAGNKTTYFVNNSELGKTAYDYANFLIGQSTRQNQAQKQPDNTDIKNNANTLTPKKDGQTPGQTDRQNPNQTPPSSSPAQTDKGVELYQRRQDQPPLSGVTLKEIKALPFFKGKVVTVKDGIVTVQLNPKQTLRIEGVVGAGGKIEAHLGILDKATGAAGAGKFLGNTITLSQLADQSTILHEAAHAVEEMGFFLEGEIRAINRAIRRETGKPVPGGVAGKEARAEWLDKNMTDRAKFRETFIGRILQKLADLIDGIHGLFVMTGKNALRAVESGKVFDRAQGKGQSTSLAPAYQESAARWFSQMEKTLSAKLPGKINANMLIAQLDAWAKKGEYKADELEWSGIKAWLKGQKDGKVTKAEVLEWLAANNVSVSEVVLGQSIGDSDVSAWWSDEGGANEETPFENLHPDDQQAARDRYRDEVADFEESATQFSQYQTFNGENYREVFLTVPETAQGWQGFLTEKGIQLSDIQKGDSKLLKEYNDWRNKNVKSWQDGHSQYSDIQNPAVRIRMSEKEIDGKRYIAVEEIQPPQKGEQEKQPEFMRKPDYWGKLAFRWLVRHAAENGFDGVMWTPGQVQADRYDLSKHIDSVEYTRNERGSVFPGIIRAYPKGSDRTGIIARKVSTEAELTDIIGKEMSEKIMSSTPKRGSKSVEFRGLDLKVGGEGLKNLYDKTLPSIANGLFNKAAWGGAKVGEVAVPISGKSENFEVKKHPEGGWGIYDGETEKFAYEKFDTKAEAESALSDALKGATRGFAAIDAPMLPITPEMRSKALREGMPLYNKKQLNQTDESGKTGTMTDKTGKGDITTGKNPDSPNGETLFTSQEALYQDILNEIKKDDTYTYGLRVIPHEAQYTPKIGDIQAASKKWIDGNETETDLSGTSAVKINPNNIQGAIIDIGAHKSNGPNGYYFGDTVVLLKGDVAGYGEDAGEALLADAQIVAVYKKSSPGKSEIVKKISPNPSSAPGQVRGNIRLQKTRITQTPATDEWNRLALEVLGKAGSIETQFLNDADFDSVLGQYLAAQGTRWQKDGRPVEDKRYLELAKDPEKNRDALQKMVDAAAKAAGYDVKAYHGFRGEPFDIFDNRSGDRSSDAPDGSNFFSSTKEGAISYSGSRDKVISAYLKLEEPWVSDFQGADWQGDAYGKYEAENPDTDERRLFNSEEEAIEWLESEGVEDADQYIRQDPWVGMTTNGEARIAKENGMDGAIIENVIDYGSKANVLEDPVTVYVTFKSNQAKRTDPVTYDDNGQVIPLSQRFNPANEDIRYQSDTLVHAFYSPMTKKIYVRKSSAKKDTIFHEYTHAVIIKLMADDPAFHQKGLDLVADTQYFKDAVKNGYGDLALEEALVQAIGEKGAQIQDTALKNRFSMWLRRLFHKVRGVMRKLTGREMTFEEFTESFAWGMREGKYQTGAGGNGLQFQAVHHGGPNIWPPEPGFPHGRPRLDKIGSGEGAAAYGWGWYSAESESVGRDYKNRLSGSLTGSNTTPALTAMTPADKSSQAHRLVSAMSKNNTLNTDDIKSIGLEPEDFGFQDVEDEISVKRLAKYNFGASDYIQKLPVNGQKIDAYLFRDGSMIADNGEELFAIQGPTGALYKLDIPDDVMPKLLDWDRPLSEQSEYVKDILKKEGVYEQPPQARDLKSIAAKLRGEAVDEVEATAERLYARLALKLTGGNRGDDAKRIASEYLASIGIPGNRYLDGMSRGKGEGSYNYVIWDQAVLDRVALLERNGEKLDAIRMQKTAIHSDLKDVKTKLPILKTMLEQAKQYRENKNLDLPSSNTKDLNRFTNWIQTTFDLAKNFKPVRDLFNLEYESKAHAHELTAADRELTTPFYGEALTDKDREAVGEVLDAGDLDNKVYDDDELKSQFKLSPAQIEAYRSIRQALDNKLEDQVRNFLAPILHDSQPVTPELLKMITKSETMKDVKAGLKDMGFDPAQIEHISNLTNWVKQHKGYIPHKWGNSQWGVKLTVDGEDWFLDVESIGGKIGLTHPMRESIAMNKAIIMAKEKFGWSNEQIQQAGDNTRRLGELRRRVKGMESDPDAGIEIQEMLDEIKGLEQQDHFLLVNKKKLPLGLFQGTDYNVMENLVNTAAKFAFNDMSQAGMKLSAEQRAEMAKIEDAIMENVKKLQLAKGGLSHMIGRKGVKGYRRDFDKVFAEYLTGANSLTVKYKKAKDMGKVFSQVDPSKTPELWRWSKNYIADMLGETSEAGWFKKIAGGMFLAGDVSAATLNATQNWTHAVAVLRRLEPKGKAITAEQEIFTAMKDVFNEYRASKKEGRTMFTDDKNPEHAAIREMMNKGLFDPSMLGEMTGFHENKILDTSHIQKFLYKAFTGVESMNRMSTGLAAYRRAVNSGMGKDAAMKKALDLVYHAHFPYGRGNRPELIRRTGALGNVAFTFMAYPLGNITFLKSEIQDLLTDFHKGDKKAVKADMKVLGTNMAYLMAFGGVKALPFIWAAQVVFNLFNGDDDDEEFETMIRRALPGKTGQTVASGIPAALGTDMSWRMQGTDVIGLPIGFQVIGMGISRAEQAKRLWDQNERLAAFFHVMPDMVKNPWKAYQGYNEGGERKGVAPIKYTGGESAWKALGFSPTRESEAYSAMGEAKKKQERRNTKLANFAEEWIATTDDNAARRELVAEIREYNAEEREKGNLGLPIPVGAVRRSAKTRAKSRRKGYMKTRPRYMDDYMDEVEEIYSLQ